MVTWGLFPIERIFKLKLVHLRCFVSRLVLLFTSWMCKEALSKEKALISLKKISGFTHVSKITHSKIKFQKSKMKGYYIVCMTYHTKLVLYQSFHKSMTSFKLKAFYSPQT